MLRLSWPSNWLTMLPPQFASVVPVPVRQPKTRASDFGSLLSGPPRVPVIRVAPDESHAEIVPDMLLIVRDAL